MEQWGDNQDRVWKSKPRIGKSLRLCAVVYWCESRVMEKGLMLFGAHLAGWGLTKHCWIKYCCMRNLSGSNLYPCWQFECQYQDENEMWRINTVRWWFEGEKIAPAAEQDAQFKSLLSCSLGQGLDSCTHCMVWNLGELKTWILKGSLA